MFDKIIYYTNAKGGQGFDILLECNSFKSFNVFLNATEKAVQISSPDCEPIFLEGCDFDKKISILWLREEFKAKYYLYLSDITDSFDSRYMLKESENYPGVYTL